MSERKFDSEGLTYDINNLDFEAGIDSSDKLESTDIEGYLAHHHDIIILGAVEDARRAAEKDAQAAEQRLSLIFPLCTVSYMKLCIFSNRWLANNWKSAREQFLRNLGHRSQGWAGAAGPIVPRSSAKKGDTSRADSAYIDRFRDDQDTDFRSTPSAGRLLFSPLSAVKKSETTMPKTAWKIGGISEPPSGPVALPKPLLEHASVIRRLNRATFGRKSSDGTVNHDQQLSTLRFQLSPATELLDCIQDCGDNFGSISSQGFTSMADIIGYKSCLQLLGDMVTGGGHTATTSPSNTAGFFSPLCLSEEEIAHDNSQTSNLLSDSIKDRRKIMSSGAKSFFERQHEELLLDSLADHVSENGAFQAGVSPVFRSGNGTKVLEFQYFLELKRCAGTIPTICMQHTIPLQTTNGNHPGTPIWPLIVLCLRTGHLEPAVDILRLVMDNHSGSGIEPEIVYALDGYIALGEAMSRRHSGGGGTNTELSVPEFRQRFRASVLSCRDLFLTAQQAVNSGQDRFHGSSGVPSCYYDPYRMDVLNFLSLSSVNDISDDVYGGSLEDYLWCNMWFVQWSREILDSGIMNTSCGIGGRGRDGGISYVPAHFR